jgi:hypothetical protein
MTDDTKGQVHGTSPGGTAASHPKPETLQFFVGPTTSDQFNTSRLRLIPVACWKVEDIRFAFDSSFVTPDIAIEIKLLQTLREQHKEPGGAARYPPLSLFGHADPVGADDYNKALSGRRATAIYAVLIVNTNPSVAVKLWNQISATENWGAQQRQQMRSAVPPATSDSELTRVYMQQLCPAELKITPQDFLAQGADAAGKGDYQGCSRFNPLLIFSQQEESRFEAATQSRDQTTLAERNSVNAPNRRVMALLFKPGSQVIAAKWPCPPATGDKAGCIKRFWSDGDKRRHTRQPDTERKFDDTEDTFACRFYQRLITDSPCEKIVPLVKPSVEVILDSNDDFLVDASEPVAAFVRVGIWDHAFDPATGTLINSSPDSKNFIGKDFKGPLARRFYFRVKDPNASGQKEVTLKWRTEFGSGGTDDTPASQAISLTPTAADPTLFVSHAVFLVTDAVDQSQATDSGLASGNPDAGSRKLGESNHRIRKITVDDAHKLDSQIVADYTSPLGGPAVTASVPVFQRSPEERLKIKVHLVNVRNTSGGTGALTATRKQTAFDTLRSVYARCGIYLDIDEIVIDPPASCINWQTRYPASANAIGANPAVEGAGFTSGNLVPSTSQTDIINLIRARPDFDGNDIYIVYITKIFNNPIPPPSATAVLAGGPGGISFPDSWTPANAIARSFVFVGLQTVNQWADPHEMTHVTTNLRNSAGGHFHLQATVGAGPGNIDGRNLMQRFFLIGNGNTADSKRLWDEDFTNNALTPAKIPAQISAIRASRFVRPF